MGIVIGLTGGIASGKSTVSNMIRNLGFEVIDADIAARKVVEPGEPAYFKIVESFGEHILTEDGRIDRPKLGSIIFQNEEKRLLLNSIVHPAVRKLMMDEKEEILRKGARAVFLDIPLLFESKLTYMVDRIILVYVDEKTQLKRLMDRNGFTEKEATDRIRSQMPLKEKVALADAVIDNNGTLEETREQLIDLLTGWGLSNKA